MQKKTTLHYYKLGRLDKMEAALNALSEQGLQVVKPGRLIQQFVLDGAVRYVYRFDVCEAREGSADAITYAAENTRAGWEAAAKKGRWLLLRKCADQAEPDELLPNGRAAVNRLFTRRIRTFEKLRMWMIVLATVLMLGGYVTDFLPVLYSFAIPMLLALLATLEIKYLQEGVNANG